MVEVFGWLCNGAQGLRSFGVYFECDPVWAFSGVKGQNTGKISA